MVDQMNVFFAQVCVQGYGTGLSCMHDGCHWPIPPVVAPRRDAQGGGEAKGCCVCCKPVMPGAVHGAATALWMTSGTYAWHSNTEAASLDHRGAQIVS
ncbi:hypothetical protein AUJ68_04515 [Candidatus Woesearchaeota archaeon CG1_02_57_44]|nr:MAG: hypothetical protein AUJ68_04515 [Candidatus Woesearchaeota archaeon CG1_02_57_44]